MQERMEELGTRSRRRSEREASVRPGSTRTYTPCSSRSHPSLACGPSPAPSSRVVRTSPLAAAALPAAASLENHLNLTP